MTVHGPDAGGSDGWTGCAVLTVLTVLTGPEIRLAGLSTPAEPVEQEAWCDLETGHPGPHYSLGPLLGHDPWWLRWDDPGEHREFVARPFCEAPGPSAGHLECGNPHTPARTAEAATPSAATNPITSSRRETDGSVRRCAASPP